MPFDPRLAADRLRARAENPAEPPSGWPAGAPASEFTRSPAAARVGELAAEAGLFLFHFEHRAHLPLPDAHVPAHQPELAQAPEWEGGVLPERKYQSFRHDLPIGSFHPGHRAKWATHELCHGLVGFAWHPTASPLFLATAGRLAELLPVALWYGLDEAFLRRCPVHQGGGALFRTLCPDCEAAAGPLADDPDALEHLVFARRFLDRELAAIARTRATGRPVPHQWATLDLCSDGLAYAAAHADRLDSDAFHRLAHDFLVEGGGWCTSLDDLEERVVAVARALVGEPLTPLAPSPEHGRWRWILQDVAWRLLSVWEETEGEAADAIEALVDTLAGAVPATLDPDRPVADEAESALRAAIAGYAEVFDEYVVPEPGELFAVGYDLVDGHGRALAQLEDGVRSGLPLTATLLGDTLPERVAAFAAHDPPRREPLPARFAASLKGAGHAADLARYEAALRGVGTRDPVSMALGRGAPDTPLVLAPGVRVVDFDVDVVDLAEGVELGDYAPVVEGDRVTAVHGDGTPVASRTTSLVLGKDASGELLVLDVRRATAEQLRGTDPVSTDDGEIAALAGLGVLVPVRWPEHVDTEA